MIGDFDNEKFKTLSDNHKPRMTAKKWSEILEHYGYGVSDESFKKYRQGKAKPSGGLIYAMSRVLGVHYFALLEGMEIPKSSEIEIKYNKLNDNDKELILGMINRVLENDKS